MHRYLITLPGGGHVVVAGDTVCQTPEGALVSNGQETVAELGRAEYEHIGPWGPLAPQAPVTPDPYDPASVVVPGPETAP